MVQLVTQNLYLLFRLVSLTKVRLFLFVLELLLFLQNYPSLIYSSAHPSSPRYAVYCSVVSFGLACDEQDKECADNYWVQAEYGRLMHPVPKFGFSDQK